MLPHTDFARGFARRFARRFARWTAGLAIAVMCAAGAAGPVRAQQPDDGEYERCMRMVEQSPDQAFERALAWEDIGGGNPAIHCQALALVRLGHNAEAAERLEHLAVSMPDNTPPDVVASVLAHAGVAWQQAGNYARAEAVQTSALELAPNDPNIRADRAVTHFADGRYWEAIDDINLALETSGENRVLSSSLLSLRASAYRYVDVFELAMEDANRALSLDPENPEALLERGIMRRLTGDAAGARADWLRLIELHDGRPAADAARRNLELLDVDPNR